MTCHRPPPVAQRCDGHSGGPSLSTLGIAEGPGAEMVLLRVLALCWVFAPVCVEDSPPWFQNITTSLFKSPGDFLLGGLFPINDLTSNLSERLEPDDIHCNSLNLFGLGLSLVMKFAVDEINGNNDLLPNVRVGFETFDTCRQPAVIVKPTMLFLTRGFTQRVSVMCNYTEYPTRVMAVIGPQTSDMTSVVGKLLGFFLMPQISYGATSEKFSDKRLYPSFLRTVPSDSWQAQAIISLLEHFNWTWVAMVGSEDEYGKQGLREISSLAAQSSICVAYEALIPVYTDPQPAVGEILQRINETQVSVVVVFALYKAAVSFFKEAIKRNMTSVWVGSTSWALHNEVTGLRDIKTVGTMVVFADKTQKLGLLDSYAEELFKRLETGRRDRMRQTSSPPNRTAPPSLFDPCPACWNLSLANATLMTDLLVQRTAFSVYAAVYSVAHAMHRLLGCNATACQKRADHDVYPWQLLEALKNVSFQINGTQLQFDSSGNPNFGYNVLTWNWDKPDVTFVDIGSYYKTLTINESQIKWHTPNSKVPESTCSANCAPGQVRRVKGFHSCCFDCIECKEGTFQNRTEDIQCTDCPKGQWSTPSSTSCTLPTFHFLSWGCAESLAMLLAGAALLSCQAAVGGLFLRHRGTPLVRAAGGPLSALTLLSLAGACACLLLFLGEPGDAVCHLQQPLNALFPTVALSCILAVSLQVVCVTEFPSQAPSHLDALRGPGSWLLVLASCGVQGGLCGWFLQEGTSLTAHLASMEVTFVSKFLRCPVQPMLGFGLMLGFNGLLALVSFMCTFMAQRPAKQYNLARDITFSTLVYCVVWVIFIPIYTGLDDKDKSIAQVTASLLSNLGILASYFFPKCHLLLTQPELNTAEYFRTYLEGTPPTPQEEQEQ
ncbi:taste receptor type 1 member 3 [Megalops cyprinoides]|uniref:taste receptor type 1 member 3 n=1 Tax=Megalops cyprinoides TaxID=118141 RepID=UPI001863C5CA|nr:taste receptor type 1 member 3 [Megalops cyprinoides]